MDRRKARALLKEIKPGDVITADWLNSLKRAVDENTRAIRSPQNKRGTRDGDAGSNTL